MAPLGLALILGLARILRLGRLLRLGVLPPLGLLAIGGLLRSGLAVLRLGRGRRWRSLLAVLRLGGLAVLRLGRLGLDILAPLRRRLGTGLRGVGWGCGFVAGILWQTLPIALWLHRWLLRFVRHCAP
ncbi:MAG: hypothetical protein ABIN10_02560 [Specibacter sp.]